MNKEMQDLFYELKQVLVQHSPKWDTLCDIEQYIIDLEKQLEEKDKVIDEIKTYINSQMNPYEDDGDFGVDCCCDGFKLLEILERGKNANSK